jgi:Cu-processing system ATP-binding protein
MIRLTKLHKKFGHLQVLKDVDLNIKEGCITAVLGPNSSGKSTLLKIILGLVRPTSGELNIEGSIVNGTGDYRNLIGYMPQIARFPDHLKASEVLDLVEDVRGQKRKKQEELIEIFKLGPELHKKIRVLSGGTKQKISAMLALMFQPQILILDEPTAGLDPVSSRRFKELLQEQCGLGKTVLLTSHILSEIEELAQDIVFLYEGKILYSGTVEELKDETSERNLESAISELMTNGRS